MEKRTFISVSLRYTKKKNKLSPAAQKENESAHDKTYKMAFAPSEDSDQHGHPPSLIRVFAVRMKKAWVLSYLLSAQRWSDWADARADLSPLGAHPFCWFCHALARNTKTRIYNFDPLKPQFYVVELGFTGVYIIFRISAQKHRLWVPVRTASSRRF